MSHYSFTWMHHTLQAKSAHSLLPGHSELLCPSVKASAGNSTKLSPLLKGHIYSLQKRF